MRMKRKAGIRRKGEEREVRRETGPES